MTNGVEGKFFGFIHENSPDNLILFSQCSTEILGHMTFCIPENPKYNRTHHLKGATPKCANIKGVVKLICLSGGHSINECYLMLPMICGSSNGVVEMTTPRCFISTLYSKLQGAYLS
ncbi:MAG: hypothetical protein BroJett018_15280 [Chloroflexota bacterium]|nr:MAG: hypothetical protein BroJett018_15280 [Chloroflexota bacterium]